MRTIEVKWDKKTEADHRRSFDSHRTRFLRGDLARNWKPDCTFYIFDSFEAYKSDLQSKVSQLVDERLTVLGQDVPNVELLIINHSKGARGTYFGYDQKDKKVRMAYDKSFLLNYLYSNNPHPLEVQETTDHEIKHFIDRSFIKHAGAVAVTGTPVITNLNWMNLNAKGTLLEYLARMRLEGFAQFDGNLKILNHTCIEGLLLKTYDQTRVADIGIKFLTKSPTADKLDLLEMENGHNGFSCYKQGKAMFELIGMAEKVNSNNLTEVINVLNKVKFLRDFKSFYEYYYSCVSSLGLDENHSILRPQHSKIMLDAEEKEFNYRLMSSLLVK